MSAILSSFLAFVMAFLSTFANLLSAVPILPTVDNGEVLSYKGLSDKQAFVCEMKSQKPVTVNNLVLREVKGDIRAYRLEAKVDGAYQTVTEGDTVGAYRYAKFKDVTSDSFRFSVTDANSFILSTISLGYKKTKNDDFKVSSYIRSDFLGENYQPDAGRFRTTTDLMVFEACTFDETGTVTMHNMEKVAKLMTEVRKINPEIRVTLNVMGRLTKSGADAEETQDLTEALYISAMKKNREAFTKNILDVINTYGFDGVDFDWEYPYSLRSRLEFSNFLVHIDKALGEKILSASLSSWCSRLTPSAIRALDNVYVMCYDTFDENGWHAAFPAVYEAIRQMLLNGYQREQLQVGLAFYARPTDRGAYWLSYGDYAEKLGPYENVTEAEIDGRKMTLYFNGPQAIRDKTAYALDAGLGGVMIWHLDCDTAFENENSLYRVISQTISE